MTNALDELLANQHRRGQKPTCVVCGGTVEARIAIEIHKTDENGSPRGGSKTSRTSRYQLCGDHAVEAFNSLTTQMANS